MYRLFAALAIVTGLSQQLMADGWPMYRGDAARSGYTTNSLPTNLHLEWTYQPAHPPAPAWPRDSRMQFDWAPHVAIADGTLYFGSSSEDKVTALDASTGETKWTFFTDGPVRFAPVVWKDRLFVASDDGYLYFLSAADGSLIRRLRGGPKDDLVLGNGRIVSRWPVRGAPVVLDDVLYFAAGIWQSEGIFIYAVDPQTGDTLWKNDSSGGIMMPQPHGGANSKSGVSAQGYLVANADQLFVPTGRAVPAAFGRSSGIFSYYHLQRNTSRGGSQAMTAGPFLYNGSGAFDALSGMLRKPNLPGAIAHYGEGVLQSHNNRLRSFEWKEHETRDRKDNPITMAEHEEAWSIGNVAGGTSLIVAGETAVSANETTVCTVDLPSRKVVSSTEIDGIPYGLAAAEGRLYVSTSNGTISCFGPGDGDGNVVHHTPSTETAGDVAPVYLEAIDEIVAESAISDGYCVDLGCGDGSLALALARRTNLRIIAVDSDPENVAEARRKLDREHLYGQRVTVLLDDPAHTRLPKYFANLIVSGRSVTGEMELNEDEITRLQRPYGGVRCIGQPGNMKVATRGALSKAGSWTHLYSNAANTLCSTDEVKGPLSVLWYRDVDLELPQRHGRGPSPLFYQGRIFAEGMDELRAVDAYNGRTLWKFALEGALHAYNADHLTGTAGTGSNFCLANDSVYVRKGSVCFRLDAATGKQIGRFEAPPQRDGQPGTWGYIACVDDILYGSLVNERHVVRHSWKRADDQMKSLFTESTALFAMNATSGELLWRYDAQDSIRNNAIAIGDGRVFLIDRPRALDDLLKRAHDRRRARRGEEEPTEEEHVPVMAPTPHRTGHLVALEADTGKELWKSNEDVFGTMLAFSDRFDMLLMCYQSTRFRLPSEVGGRMAVFRATDGYRAWDKKLRHNTRPLVNDRTIFAHGGAWDLLTGEDKPFDLKQKSYGCGQLSGSKNLMLFRSGTLGYFDLTRDSGVENYGGIRPGCWINALPAGGLVFLPDASAGCRCSYQNRSWIALQGTD